MASRATIRSNVLIYLGTNSADKAFPADSLNVLIQNAVNEILTDIEKVNPNWLMVQTLLDPTGVGQHTYSLPTDFNRWLDVRQETSDGVQLTEVRDDELNAISGYTFSIIGADHAATLTTGPQVEAGVQLYFKYSTWPADLPNDGAAPDDIPRKFHDVVALKAAKMAFATGGEERFPPEYEQVLENREAQLFLHVGQRGVESMTIRGTQS